MRVTTAFLCDAATVREGLLHALGAPISRIWRTPEQRDLHVYLAMLVAMEEQDYGIPHEIRANLIGPNRPLGEVVGVFVMPKPDRLEPNEILEIPQVLSLVGAPWEDYGCHTIEIFGDGHGPLIKTFYMLHPEEQVLPPISD
jgi:hypothetical protein